MKCLGVGIIGTGGIADSGHAPAVNAVGQTSSVAVLSRDASRGQDFLRRHNFSDAAVHPSLDGFANDPRIDLAIICSPDRLHAEQATACLSGGKHVLLEKPITVDAESSLELVKLSDANHLTLTTGFHLRSHTGHRALRKLIVDQEEIGVLRHIRAVWAFPHDGSNWRAEKTLAKWWSLSAVGSHCLDLARWFADNMTDWQQLSSVISRDIWKGPHDETAVIAGQFSDGPTVEIVSSIQFGQYNRLEIFGEEGHAVCEGMMGREGSGSVNLNDQPILFEATSPFVGQLKDVAGCIETQSKPRADGFVGLRSVKDLLLAHDA